jgi:hypothetical protein
VAPRRRPDRATMPPIAHEGAIKLWNGGDREQWRAHAAAYDERLRALNLGERLSKLDAFVRKELPKTIAQRRATSATSDDWGYIKKDEYVRVVEWKLARGKTRPGLMKYAQALSERDVESASREAYRLAHASEGGKRNSKGKIADAMAPFIALKGCGPATASILMAVGDERFPFFSDEALAVVVGNGGNDRYSAARYHEFMKALHRKCDDLGADDLTPAKLESALWSAAALTMPKKMAKTKQ